MRVNFSGASFAETHWHSVKREVGEQGSGSYVVHA